MKLPPVVSSTEWQAAREELLAKEKDPQTPPYEWWRRHDEYENRGR